MKFIFALSLLLLSGCIESEKPVGPFDSIGINHLECYGGVCRCIPDAGGTMSCSGMKRLCAGMGEIMDCKFYPPQYGFAPHCTCPHWPTMPNDPPDPEFERPEADLTGHYEMVDYYKSGVEPAFKCGEHTCTCDPSVGDLNDVNTCVGLEQACDVLGQPQPGCEIFEDRDGNIKKGSFCYCGYMPKGPR